MVSQSHPYLACVLLLASAVIPSACSLFTDVEEACPQTYEFGNYGCARILAIIEGPPKPWPNGYRWSVRAVAADTFLGITAMGDDPVDGQVPLLIILQWERLPGDTASFWVVAKILEDPRPAVVGVPLPVFAEDKVLRLVRFVDVGQIPSVDTVRLSLKATSGDPGALAGRADGLVTARDTSPGDAFPP